MPCRYADGSANSKTIRPCLRLGHSYLPGLSTESFNLSPRAAVAYSSAFASAWVLGFDLGSMLVLSSDLSSCMPRMRSSSYAGGGGGGRCSGGGRCYGGRSWWGGPDVICCCSRQSFGKMHTGSSSTLPVRVTDASTQIGKSRKQVFMHDCVLPVLPRNRRASRPEQESMPAKLWFKLQLMPPNEVHSLGIQGLLPAIVSHIDCREVSPPHPRPSTRALADCMDAACPGEKPKDTDWNRKTKRCLGLLEAAPTPPCIVIALSPSAAVTVCQEVWVAFRLYFPPGLRPQ